jgi:hypothetical protein
MKTRNVALCSKVFHVPYEYLWNYLTNPLMFPVLYPNWIAEIRLRKQDEYEVKSPSGDRFYLYIHTNSEYGIIDFKMIDQEGREDICHTRLLPVDEGSTAIIHAMIEKQNSEITAAEWQAYRETIEDDCENARKIVENVYMNSGLLEPEPQ